jgi:hypothetical protein
MALYNEWLALGMSRRQAGLIWKFCTGITDQKKTHLAMVQIFRAISFKFYVDKILAEVIRSSQKV